MRLSLQRDSSLLDRSIFICGTCHCQNITFRTLRTGKHRAGSLHQRFSTATFQSFIMVVYEKFFKSPEENITFPKYLVDIITSDSKEIQPM